MNFKNNMVLLALISLIMILSFSMIHATDIENSNDTVSTDDAQEVITSGNTVYISPGGNGDGSSENSPTNWNTAVNKVSSGDTIQFANGTYTDIEGTVYGFNLKGSGNTTIDAQNAGGFFTTSGSVTIENISFKNAYTGEKEGNPDGPKTGYDGEGAIINKGYLTVKNCYFENNQGIGTEGGAIHNSGTAYIYDSVFYQNGGKKGGAIYSDKNTRLYIYNSIINHCVSREGSAVHAKEATVEIHNCTIANSSAKNGLLYIKKSQMIIEDSYFYSSKAVDAAGVINVDEKSYLTVNNCVFDHLTASGTKLWFHDENGTGNGGAIVVEKDARSVIIKNSIFTNCSAKGVGGAIYLQSNTEVTIENCTFKSNSAGYGGANIYGYSTYYLTVTNSTFEASATLTTQNIAYGNSERISISSIDDGTNLNIGNSEFKVLLNGKDTGKTISSNGYVLVDNLTPGIYTVTLTSKETSSNKFIINSSSSFIVINQTGKSETYLKIMNNNEIIINLTDGNGNGIPNEEITVEINGNSKKYITENGIAKISAVDLKMGKYTVYAKYDGNDIFSSSEDSLNIEILPIIIAGDMKKAQNSGEDFKAVLLDNNGNLMVNESIIFTVNNVNYSVKTNSNGEAILNLNLNAGKYDVSIINPVNSSKLYYKLEIVKRITASDITSDYSYSKYYTVTVYDNKGNIAGSGVNVNITLNKQKHILFTNSKGVVKLNVKDLLPKSYSIKAECNGVAVTNKIVIKHILKASNKSYKRLKVKKYSATLKTSAGKAIKNKKITFKIKGKTYSAKTNKKGIATINIKSLTKTGSYKITVSYLKDSIKKTVTIKK